MYFKMKTRHSDTLLKFWLLESPGQESCFSPVLEAHLGNVARPCLATT